MLSILRSVLVLSACALAACASHSPRTAHAPPAPAANQAELRIVTDGRYIARVERKARMRGIDVQWINPPVRRIGED